VIEHLERPQEAIIEMYRIVKPGGHIILTCPLFWHIHEEPRDFFRYTKYGIGYMFEKVGFKIVEIRPLSGFVVTFAQEFVYYLDSFKGNRMLIYGINILQWIIQKAAYYLNKYDKSYHFTWMYLVIAKKPI
jgi:SAM-dependent methyltransferase